MRIAITITLALLSAGLGVGQTPRIDYSLDLTAQDASSEEEYETVPEGEGVGSAPRILPPPVIDGGSAAQPPALPFELGDLTFDRSDYRLGDTFEYELTLRYAGKSAMTFPISKKAHLFRQKMPGVRYATLAVDFDDPVMQHQMAATESLYGSDEVPGSLLVLAADQTIRIRGAAVWSLHWPGSVDPFVPWSGSVKPYAVLNIHYLPRAYYAAKSAPAVSIRLATRD